jgi:hypothetical protein
MNPVDDNLRNCLLSIMQRGITECRSFALSGNLEAVACLMDALDNMPRHLAHWTEVSELEIKDQLDTLMQSVPTLPTNYVWMFENRICTL